MSDPSDQSEPTGDPATRADLLLWLEQYGDEMYAHAVSRVESSQAAEEIVQETFLAALQNYAKFERRAAPKTWLVAILRNKIINHYRQRARRRSETVSSGDDSPLGLPFDSHGIWNVPIGPWPRRPDEELQRREFWQAFDQCLAKLPPGIAESFVLRVLDGLDTENICKTLGISASNLAVRLHRARLALRDCLGKNWFGDE